MPRAAGARHRLTVFLALLADCPSASEIGFQRVGIAAARSADFRAQLSGATLPPQAATCSPPERLLVPQQKKAGTADARRKAAMASSMTSAALADFAPRCSYPPSLGPVASGVDY